MLQEILSKSPDAFLDKLNLRRHAEDNEFKKFIFRGQADAKWPIIPSVLRESTIKDRFKISGELTFRKLIQAECDQMNRYVLTLNKAGLPVPNYEELVHECDDKKTDFENQSTRAERIWPPKSYNSIIALAQHSKIPTRFLDWSHSPYVATYFAAKDCIRQLKLGKKINKMAVYEIDANDIEDAAYEFDYVDPIVYAAENYHCHLASNKSVWNAMKIRKEHENKNYECAYKGISIPSEHNRNLQAQKGVLLGFFEKNFRADDKVKPTSLVDYVTQKNLGSDGKFQLEIKIVKHTISSQHCPKLLRLLSYEGIDASTMFPSPEGAAEAVAEHYQYWDLYQ